MEKGREMAAGCCTARNWTIPTGLLQIAVGVVLMIISARGSVQYNLDVIAIDTADAQHRVFWGLSILTGLLLIVAYPIKKVEVYAVYFVLMCAKIGYGMVIVGQLISMLKELNDLEWKANLYPNNNYNYNNGINNAWNIPTGYNNLGQGVYYVMNNSQFVRGVVIGLICIVSVICFAEAIWIMLIVGTWRSLRENRVGTAEDRRPVITPSAAQVEVIAPAEHGHGHAKIDVVHENGGIEAHTNQHVEEEPRSPRAEHYETKTEVEEIKGEEGA